ncbi:hypothetical protein BH09SUM1_BH09SUM1_18700 [soil metagenome]
MSFVHEVSESIRSAGSESGVCYSKCVFDPAIKIFAGHFPGNPIAPGIALLQLARTVVEKARGEKLSVAAVESAKFLRSVRPGEEVVITWRASEQETGTLRIDVRGTVGEERAFIAVLKLRRSELA